MAFDFNALTPTNTTMSERRAGRVAAENPFLSRDWVLNSYETGQPMQVEVPGKVESYERTGKNAGPAEKITGEATSAITMIRRAADKLSIGVRIEAVPHPKKKDVIVIKFLGVERKQRKNQDDK